MADVLSILSDALAKLGSPDELRAFAPGLKRFTISGLLGNLFQQGIEFPSATKALRKFQVAGLGIRESDFRRIFNSAETDGARQTRLRNFPASLTPPQSLFIPADHELPSSYLYRVSYTAIDPATGLEYRSTEAVFSDTPLSNAQVSESLKNFINRRYSDTLGLNLISIGDVVNGYVSPDIVP